MNILLSWVFDHLVAAPQSLSATQVDDLAQWYTRHVVEVAQVTRRSLRIGNWHVVRVVRIVTVAVGIRIDFISLSTHKEAAIDISVADYENIGSLSVDDYCLLVCNEDKWRLVLYSDLDLSSTAPLPKLFIGGHQSLEQRDLLAVQQLGALSAEQVLFHIENTSITHRPDLWGHRGHAREMARFFNTTLKNQASLTEHMIKLPSAPSLIVSTDGVCAASFIAGCRVIANDRVNGIYLPWAVRLAAMDVKARMVLIDVTNYVLFDWGHPSHCFDAQAIGVLDEPVELIARFAKPHERLVTLDGVNRSLNEEDTVIANRIKPISLAGIIGGYDSGVTAHSTDVIFEAAYFDSSAIRATSKQQQVRTESSLRFEKSVDSHQVIPVIDRILHLILKEISLPIIAVGPITTAGKHDYAESIDMVVDHARICDLIGADIAIDRIASILRDLGYAVDILTAPDTKMVQYLIGVPSFRAVRGQVTDQDIVEEVVRRIGFDALPSSMPALFQQKTYDERYFLYKQLARDSVYRLNTQQLWVYPLYQEAFLRRYDMEARAHYTIKNPVSEDMYRLATSLIPNMLGQVAQEAAMVERMRLTALQHCWPAVDAEQPVWTFLAYDAKQALDWYEHKEMINTLFAPYGILFEWHSSDRIAIDSWWLPAQTALLRINNTVVGIAGFIHPRVTHLMNVASVFAVEIFLDSVPLQSFIPVRFQRPSRFPSVDTHLSLKVPFGVSYQDVVNLIKSVDSRIVSVRLIDRYEQSVDYQSYTLGYVTVDHQATLSKDQIDGIRYLVVQRLLEHGIRIG